MNLPSISISELPANGPAEVPTAVPRIAIRSIVFGDGTTVDFAANDIVVIVGPNNAGKSASLRAIRDKLQNASHASPVVQTVSIVRSGSIAVFSDWLLSWTVRQTESQPDNPVYQALGHAMHRSQAHADWQRDDSVLGGLARWFCHLLTADERLQICNPPGNIALARDNPSHPFHFLLRDDKLEARLSEKFRKAFGVDLVVHRNAGSTVPVHVGTRPTPEAGEDRASIPYIQRLELLPTLHSQGDGMRSFAGVLLATSVGRESVMLIDEPEAFLHPPQARQLGSTLVLEKAQERQLFIATHSTDVVRGILETESTNVRVLRIRRSGSTNSIRVLNSDRIKQLWGDPLLRYSNILDGLFHESVIVCEADADCRFYSAVLDALVSSQPDDRKKPDLMFTHCGGKTRLPVVIRALREVDVPVRAVADFDVLSDEQPLRSIVQALGADWASVEPDWRILKAAIDTKKPDLTTAEVTAEIEAVLTSIDSAAFPAAARATIATILKRTSPWAHAKLAGKAFVPSGEATRACDRLLQALRSAGLYVVEVGELEGYVRSEGGHGPKWVNAVLTRQLATDHELETARRFVRELASLGAAGAYPLAQAERQR